MSFTGTVLLGDKVGNRSSIKISRIIKANQLKGVFLPFIFKAVLSIKSKVPSDFVRTASSYRLIGANTAIMGTRLVISFFNAEGKIELLLPDTYITKV